MEEKERYEFGQRTLFNNREELTTFDGFNLDDFMQIICKLLNQQDKENQQLKQQLAEKEIRIAELEEQLKKSLESNNDLLKQTMELQSQLIIERLKGEVV